MQISLGAKKWILALLAVSACLASPLALAQARPALMAAGRAFGSAISGGRATAEVTASFGSSAKVFAAGSGAITSGLSGSRQSTDTALTDQQLRLKLLRDIARGGEPIRPGQWMSLNDDAAFPASEPAAPPAFGEITHETLAGMCRGSGEAIKSMNQILQNKTYWFARNSADRADLTQQTLLKIWRACERLLGKKITNPSAFVATIMKNEWSEMRRSQSAKIEASSASENAYDPLMDQGVFGMDPAKRLGQRQLLDRMLSNLSPRQKEAILNAAAGNSLDETAAAMKIKPSRAKELLYDGRKRLTYNPACNSEMWRSLCEALEVKL